jgi:hypothetical protein
LVEIDVAKKVSYNVCLVDRYDQIEKSDIGYYEREQENISFSCQYILKFD